LLRHRQEDQNWPGLRISHSGLKLILNTAGASAIGRNPVRYPYYDRDHDTYVGDWPPPRSRPRKTHAPRLCASRSLEGAERTLEFGGGSRTSWPSPDPPSGFRPHSSPSREPTRGDWPPHARRRVLPGPQEGDQGDHRLVVREPDRGLGSWASPRREPLQTWARRNRLGNGAKGLTIDTRLSPCTILHRLARPLPRLVGYGT